VISGPYYRLHCDAERCGAIEDFELEEVENEIDPHFDSVLIERAVLRARSAGWTFPENTYSYSRGPVSSPEFRSGDDRGRALCPKCTQLEADR
jgi:hypothetical protein